MPPILAADTVVWLDGEAFGKPGDAQRARQMLRALRGRVHRVVTGIAVIPEGKRNALVRTPVTEVKMREYTDDEIEESIRRGDPFDKAGGYGIQDTAFQPVQQYLGCYCNVIGLSLWATIELMQKAGLSATHPAQILPQCEHCPLRPR
jgi:MAF protein